MKIQELIEELQKYPKDTIVELGDRDSFETLDIASIDEKDEIVVIEPS